MDLTFPFLSTGLLNLVYGIVATVGVLELLTLGFIPALLQRDATPKAVGKAIYCYLMQMFGILLMTLSGLPAVGSVLAGLSYSSSVYLALLIIFTLGGLIFLWHENVSHAIDEASRAVPFAIYYYTFKTIGFVLMSTTLLFLILTMLLHQIELEPTWWVSPTIFFFYGGLLSWSTRWPYGHHLNFENSPLSLRPPPPPQPRPLPASVSLPALSMTMKKPKMVQKKRSS
ncbi:hypothetical protein HY285_05160 [Candidatus Peregrinibacteria bacterium]|nr:hypothetical protein [Candidatus Peregrinibacteria bacterium]MBI3816901.1 hypothetical protein [Candidatus Peregrinibacteria bacterium]